MGNTPLLMAGGKEGMKIMMMSGGPHGGGNGPKYVDPFGTPGDVISLLINRGANINHQSAINGSCLLSACAGLGLAGDFFYILFLAVSTHIL